jgi:hypothetical protein
MMDVLRSIKRLDGQFASCYVPSIWIYSISELVVSTRNGTTQDGSKEQDLIGEG